MLTVYHSPNSRSSSTIWQLEELEVAYELHKIDVRAPNSVPESYRTIQPNKKVPALVHDGVTITERAAIGIYLGDRFPEPAIVPALDDARRGPYLSWMVYFDSVFDPVLAARLLKFEYAPNATSYGAYDDMIAHLERTLTAQRFLLGDHFSLADIQYAGGINWAFYTPGAFPDKPVFRDYVARVQDRPSFMRALAKDQ